VQVQNLTIWGNRYNLSLSRQDGHIDLDVEPLSENKNHPFQIDPETELPALFA